MSAPALEPVRLADGEAAQALVAGVAPIALVTRDLAAHAARKAARRGAADLPAGGLFDTEARRQSDLFGA